VVSATSTTVTTAPGNGAAVGDIVTQVEIGTGALSIGLVTAAGTTITFEQLVSGALFAPTVPGDYSPLYVWKAIPTSVAFQPFDCDDTSLKYQFNWAELLLGTHSFGPSTLVMQTDMNNAASAAYALSLDTAPLYRLQTVSPFVSNSAVFGPYDAVPNPSSPWEDWGGRWVRFGTPAEGRQGTQLYMRWTVSSALIYWRLLGVSVDADPLDDRGRKSAT